LPGTGINYTTPVQHLPSGQHAQVPVHVQPPAPNAHPGELTVHWAVLLLLAMAAVGLVGMLVWHGMADATASR
jgi:hypothetical protein